MKLNVLFVDDEPRILQGIRRMLRSMRQEWEMDFVGCAADALEALEQKPVDIVVSDMRMPGMDGAEFLNEVMERYPRIARLALSGQADEETVYRTVRRVHQFLSKPCDPEMLKATIQRLCTLRQLLADEQLVSLTMQLKTIPSPPEVYDRLVRELESDMPSIQEVGRIIGQDVGMTAKILQMINSAFFGLRHRISDPARAVSLLGMETVRNLVLIIHIFSVCKDQPKTADLLAPLWSHSMRVGMLAQELARQERGATGCTEDARGAGVLHDVGQLILIVNRPAEYEAVLALTETKNISVSAAEERVFGTTHAKLGAYLLGLWGLVEPVVEAVAMHHEPVGEKSFGFTASTAVHVADVIDRELHPVPALGPAEQPNVQYLDAIGLSAKLPEWRELCTKLDKESDVVDGTQAA